MSADEVRRALSEAARILATLAVTHQELTGPRLAIVEPPRATNVEECLLLAAPAPGEMPISIRALAKRSGYAYTRWLRERVEKLVREGKLQRGAGGVRRRG